MHGTFPQRFSRRPGLRVRKSYGVAICRYNIKTNKYEMMLVKKRCTYNYVEFVIGHYTKNNESRLTYLFNGMTNDEKRNIMSLDYGQIYQSVFLINPASVHFDDPNYTSEDMARFRTYKYKFDEAFTHDGGLRLRRLLTGSPNVETIWEIPKGRKSYPQEKELMCAVRETWEESGVNADQYTLLMDISPRRLTNIDMQIKYVNYLYIGVINDPQYKPNINFSTNQQISEVVNVKWMDLDMIKTVDDCDILYNFAKIVFKLLKKKEKVGKVTKLKSWTH